MSLYDLALEMYEMFDYTFKEDLFDYIFKKDFLPFSKTKESRLNKTLNLKRWEFILVYISSKQLFIKKFKEKFGCDDRVCHNCIRIYLDNVDEEHACFVNGVLLAPISYGTRYIRQEGDQNSEQIFHYSEVIYDGVKNYGIHWP